MKCSWDFATVATPTWKHSSLWNKLIIILLVDIDECQVDLDNCHADAFCTNTDGSFNCTCFIGYAGDGVTCKGKRKKTIQHIVQCRKNEHFLI